MRVDSSVNSSVSIVIVYFMVRTRFMDSYQVSAHSVVAATECDQIGKSNGLDLVGRDGVDDLDVVM